MITTPPAISPMRKKTWGNQGRLGASGAAKAPAMPAVPHTVAMIARVRHSGAPGGGSALIAGHFISRHSHILSASHIECGGEGTGTACERHGASRRFFACQHVSGTGG